MTHSEGFLVATVVLAGSLLFAPALIQRANAGHEAVVTLAEWAVLTCRFRHFRSMGQ